MSFIDRKSIYKRDLTEDFPDKLTIKLGKVELVYRKRLFDLPDDQGRLVQSGLRYGENPDQPAAMYRLVNGNLALSGLKFVGPKNGLVSKIGDGAADAIHGSRKHPSKTNLTDVDSALGIVRYLPDEPAAVIVKHNNPSGAAMDPTLAKAFQKAFEADRVAAFGGALVVNRPLDVDTASLMIERYMEVVAAPDFEEGVLGILAKKPDLRIFKISDIARLKDYALLRFLDIKSLIDGGLILQHSAVNAILSPSDFKPAEAEKGGARIASEREPTEAEFQDLLFGWAVEQGVISNSVLFVKNKATVAIGCGQQDRVGVVEIAAFKARRNYAESLAFANHGLTLNELSQAAGQGSKPSEALSEILKQVADECGNLKGSSMVSDAFFPFRDSVDAAIKQGVTAIAHPGGSLRDFESLEAANAANPKVAMVFTGQRAFKH
ncbi:MAG: IMP cyclohydrolase [Deltaproteobacteria bacterium]|jgi:phosphoribosylaminoimidazolecarboxamide formyltransferase/IMP cyclohydrolase|nr:IMP cyclohydrolase [Deltaproteobacteria bacterium]